MIPFEKLKEHQKLILKLFANPLYTYNVIIGGRGTFKTSTSLMGWYAHCMANPGQRLYFCGTTYDSLEKIIVEEWQRQIPEQFYKLRWGGDQHYIELPVCESLIEFVQYNHPTPTKAAEKIRGANISGYHMLQPDVLHDDGEYFSQIDQAVRLFGDHTTTKHKRVLDLNAPYPGHWVEQLFLKKGPRYLGSQEGRVGVIHIETKPETSIYSAEQIETMRITLAPHLFERLVKGYPAEAEGLIYPKYTEYLNAIDPKDITEYLVGIDPGEGQHPWAAVFVGKLSNNEWVQFAEIGGKDKNYDKILESIDSIVEFWGPEKCQAWVYDWSAIGWKDHFMRKTKFRSFPHFYPAGPRTRDKWFRVEAGIQNLYHSLVTAQLRIHVSCNGTKRDLNNYSWHENGKPDKKKYDPHYLDALRYVWIRARQFDEN